MAEEPSQRREEWRATGRCARVRGLPHVLPFLPFSCPPPSSAARSPTQPNPTHPTSLLSRAEQHGPAAPACGRFRRGEARGGAVLPPPLRRPLTHKVPARSRNDAPAGQTIRLHLMVRMQGRRRGCASVTASACLKSTTPALHGWYCLPFSALLSVGLSLGVTGPALRGSCLGPWVPA